MRDLTIPTLSANIEGNINITIPANPARLIEDQGYTYNQAGFTFNQLGVMYGGNYNYTQDFLPILSVAKLEQPTLTILNDYITLSSPETQVPLELSITDMYKGGYTRYLYAGMPMGLLLDLTYPVTIKIVGYI
jgi:hypothetical protein